MLRSALLLVTGLALATGAAGAGPSSEDSLRVRARHEAVVRDIPAGAKKVRIWLTLPREDPAQRVSGFRFDGQAVGRLVRGGTYDNVYAYYEVDQPPSQLKMAVEFDVERRAVSKRPDPGAARPLAEAERSQFERELKADRFVPVGGKYSELARQIVGGERNPVRQARKVYDWVLGYVEYWVKNPQVWKASANGESDYCLSTKTGNCTDFHSLYASLTRSLGIPTRIVYGSFFQGENTPLPNRPTLDGKETDASYHCWIEFYAPGAGWIPLDVALADLFTDPARQQWYFGNLDARRVTWSYGRDLTLAPPQAAGPVNAMHKVYVEVDDRPHAAWDRVFTYRSQPAG